MTLDALRIALQGLYELTPVSLAVQGLIAEIEEERREKVNGSGGQVASPVRSRPLEDPAWVERMAREKWEYIEAAQARDAAREAAREAARLAVERAQLREQAAPAAPAPVEVVASVIQTPDPGPDLVAMAHARRVKEEAEMLAIVAAFL